jgi:hypothetical protein
MNIALVSRGCLLLSSLRPPIPNNAYLINNAPHFNRRHPNKGICVEWSPSALYSLLYSASHTLSLIRRPLHTLSNTRVAEQSLYTLSLRYTALSFAVLRLSILYLQVINERSESY